VDRKPNGQTPGGQQKFSYGAYVLDARFDHIDLELRQLAADCTNENPAHRPRLTDIENLIQTKLAQNWPISDHQLRTRAMELFKGRPPRKKRAPSHMISMVSESLQPLLCVELIEKKSRKENADDIQKRFQWLQNKLSYRKLLRKAELDGPES
jgi:hypothetical protein